VLGSRSELSEGIDHQRLGARASCRRTCMKHPWTTSRLNRGLRLECRFSSKLGAGAGVHQALNCRDLRAQPLGLEPTWQLRKDNCHRAAPLNGRDMMCIALLPRVVVVAAKREEWPLSPPSISLQKAREMTG
jgi:hypothetical protein